MDFKVLEKKAIELRKGVVQTIYEAGFAYLGASMSPVEMLVSLYYALPGKNPLLKFDSNKPAWDQQDYFVLSKTAATPLYYNVLADLGFFPQNELKDYAKVDSLLKSRVMRKVPGVVYGVGPYSDGFAFACGLALSLKKEKATNRVYTLVADYELEQGDFWESALLAAHHFCDNLTVLLDCSGVQLTSYLRSIINLDPLQSKFESFGFKVFQVIDGHDYAHLMAVMAKAQKVKRQPVVILCRTVCGKALPFAENNPSYFAASMSKSEYDEAMKVLNQKLNDYE